MFTYTEYVNISLILGHDNRCVFGNNFEDGGLKLSLFFV